MKEISLFVCGILPWCDPNYCKHAVIWTLVLIFFGALIAVARFDKPYMRDGKNQCFIFGMSALNVKKYKIMGWFGWLWAVLFFFLPIYYSTSDVFGICTA